jgi:hypothetical protein
MNFDHPNLQDDYGASSNDYYMEDPMILSKYEERLPESYLPRDTNPRMDEFNTDHNRKHAIRNIENYFQGSDQLNEFREPPVKDCGCGCQGAKAKPQSYQKKKEKKKNDILFILILFLSLLISCQIISASVARNLSTSSNSSVNPSNNIQTNIT